MSSWTKIDPLKNCYRTYQIILETDFFVPYRIRQEWGRVNSNKRQQKIHPFDDEAQAIAFMDREERRRIRRGYTQLTVL